MPNENIGTGNGQDTSNGDGKNTDLNPGNQNTDSTGSGNVDGNQPPANDNAGKPENKPADSSKKPSDDDLKPIYSKSDVERLIRERLDREQRVKDQEMEQQRRDAEIQQLREKGEFEQLLKLEQSRTKELEDRIQEMERNGWKRAAMTRHKLPEEAFNRLLGNSEQEILRDAEELSRLMGPRRQHVDNEGGNRSQKVKDQARQQTEQKLKTANRYHSM